MGNINLENIDPKGQKRRENKSEQKRSPNEILNLIDSSMERNISIINKKLSFFENIPENILNNNGQINPYSFQEEYSKPEIDQDMVIMNEKKKAFFQTYSPSVQERYGEIDQNKLVKIIEHDKKEKMRDGNISEDILFLLLNKVSCDRYLAVKSSDYDDYENGTDMLLIDTESNSVICAFDATISGVNSRMNHKMKRAKDRVDSGRGMYVKYGISFNDKKEAKLGFVKNISPLFLDLDKNDLAKLLQIMDFNIDSDLSDVENGIVNNLLDKISDQIEELEIRSAKNISYESSREFLSYVRGVLA